MRRLTLFLMLCLMGLATTSRAQGWMQYTPGACLLTGCTMTGPILYAAGSAAAPSVSWSGDTTKGIYFDTNGVYIANSGVQNVRFREDGAITFYDPGTSNITASFGPNGGSLRAGNKIRISWDGTVIRFLDDADATKQLEFDMATITTGQVRVVTWPDVVAGTVGVLAANGLYARTGAGTVAARTITGGTGVTVVNGDGVSGNPTASVDTAVVDTYTSGTATPSAACSPGELYFETDVDKLWGCTSTNTWTDATASGAPTDAEYIVGSADATLSAERVVTDTETLKWDTGTASQLKADVLGFVRPTHKTTSWCAGGGNSATVTFYCLGGPGSYNSCNTEGTADATSTMPATYTCTTSAIANNTGYLQSEDPAVFVPGIVNHFEAVVSLEQTTSQRVFVGLTDDSPGMMAADDPADHVAMFRHSTNASDTNWQCITNDGAGGGTITDTGIAVATGRTELAIASDASNIYFYIDQTLECTHSTNLPTNALDMGAWVRTLTTATKEIRVGALYLESVR